VAAHDLAEQIAHGEHAVFGVMMESFLVDGRQDLKNPAALRYGQSITDACMGWEMTVPVLADLARAVRARRTTS
jgi:3-deoxy-7-phosphoheptulonate synthase